MGANPCFVKHLKTLVGTGFYSYHNHNWTYSFGICNVKARNPLPYPTMSGKVPEEIVLQNATHAKLLLGIDNLLEYIYIITQNEAATINIYKILKMNKIESNINVLSFI